MKLKKRLSFLLAIALLLSMSQSRLVLAEEGNINEQTNQTEDLNLESNMSGKNGIEDETSSKPTEEETQGSGTETSSKPTEEETQGSGTESSSEPTEEGTQESGTETSSEPTEEGTQESGTETSSEPAEEGTQESGTETSSEPMEEETQESETETSSDPTEEGTQGSETELTLGSSDESSEGVSLLSMVSRIEKIEIHSVDDFMKLSGQELSDVEIYLMSDINLQADNKTWKSITKLSSSTFHGNNYNIILSDSDQSLVDILDNSTITNLMLNLTVNQSNDYTNRSFVGAFANQMINNSLIEGCSNHIKISATNKDIIQLGGIVGAMNDSTIKNCENHGYISASNGGLDVGGIVGFAMTSNIENCSNSVEISANNTGTAYVGGIVGRGTSSKIINCTNSGNIITSNGKVAVGGIVGKISETNISGSNNSGSIVAKNGDMSSEDQGFGMGGIVGNGTKSTITNCKNTGSIKGSNGHIHLGGIVGGLTYGSKIKNCINEATLQVSESMGVKLGGVVGSASLVSDSSASIENCINSGALQISSCSESMVGGIAGKLVRSGDVNVFLQNLLNTGNVVGNEAGGIIGNGKNLIIETSYNAGKISGNNIAGIIGEGENITCQSCMNVGYISLQSGNGNLNPIADATKLNSESSYNFFDSTIYTLNVGDVEKQKGYKTAEFLSATLNIPNFTQNKGYYPVLDWMKNEAYQKYTQVAISAALAYSDSGYYNLYLSNQNNHWKKVDSQSVIVRGQTVSLPQSFLYESDGLQKEVYVPKLAGSTDIYAVVDYFDAYYIQTVIVADAIETSFKFDGALKEIKPNYQVQYKNQVQLDPKEKVTMTYYRLNGNEKIKTTTENSGSLALGSAPKKVGTYQLSIEFAGYDQYLGSEKTIQFSILPINISKNYFDSIHCVFPSKLTEEELSLVFIEKNDLIKGNYRFELDKNEETQKTTISIIGLNNYADTVQYSYSFETEETTTHFELGEKYYFGNSEQKWRVEEDENTTYYGGFDFYAKDEATYTVKEVQE